MNTTSIIAIDYNAKQDIYAKLQTKALNTTSRPLD